MAVGGNIVTNFCTGITFRPYVAPSGPPATNLWADWDATTGITQSSNRISAWVDKVNGRTLAQATSGLQPLWNGTNAITFSGTRGDTMKVSGTLTTEYTLYFIADVNVTVNSDAAGFAYDDVGATNLYLIVNRASSINNMVAYGNNFANVITSTVSVANATYYMFKAKFAGASSLLTVNSTTTTGNLGTAGTITPFNLGYVGTNSTTWDVKRILVYQGSHDETGVASYFTTTYGVP